MAAVAEPDGGRHHPAVPAVGRRARRTTGETLNAVVFGDIIAQPRRTTRVSSHALLTVVLVFEGALLFVAANTGFLGGPAVLANMAVGSLGAEPVQRAVVTARRRATACC